MPISSFTDFSYTNKSSNILQVTTTIKNDIVSNPDFIDIITDEFINSQNDCIYQSKLIALPDNSNLQLEIKNIDSIYLNVENPSLFISVSASDNQPLAYLGNIGIMRGLKIVPLTVRQYRYDNKTQKIICYTNIDVNIKADKHFPVFASTNQTSNSWSQLYNNTILNYEENTLYGINTGLPQGYLIIVADALYNSILPLARWKNQKGWTVTVKKTSEIGSSGNDIRNFITQAYTNQTPRPEYVLLVGSSTLIPTIPIAATISDHLYACVDGDDLYPDLFIGRLPASNTSELGIMVAKIIGYEQTPYLTDTLWYKKALMVATSYQSSGVPVWTALATKRWIRDFILQHNYFQVDTVFYPPVGTGVGVIDTIVNSGVTFVNGRGWGNREGWSYPYFKIQEVYNLNNGWKLPVVTSFYCATGNYGAESFFGKAWLVAGTPTNPKGGIAFYGPVYATTSTRFNNCQDYGVYWGIFEEKISNCGPAMFRGKIELLNNFPLRSDSLALVTHVSTYNLMGDPSLDMWGDEVPKQFQVSYPTQLAIGSSQLTVLVQNSLAQPIPNALVSLVKTDEVKAIGYTNEVGIASFNFTTASEDTLFVTVTKHNFVPHLGHVQIITSPLFVGYYSHAGNIIAGQSDNLSVSLKNYGTSQTANNTFATLRSYDDRVIITDSIQSYGDIAPGQVQTSNPFQFTVATNCTNNHKVNFQLSITSGSNNWQAGFDCSVRAAELTYKSHLINDGNNGILDPNETANLVVKIYNRGLENIANVTAILRSANPYAIQVLDSIGDYGTLNIGETLQNTTDYFTLHASSAIAFGRKFYLQLVLRSTNYERIVEFPIIIGQVATTSPFGPDQYGYWAYDNTDTQYSECPTYNWQEIDPNYGGSGVRLAMANHAIRRVSLPFTFKYYGQNYNRISIASNGYMAMDSTWIIDPYNWSIPSPMGPPGLIAPFWDDFHPETLSSSGVYYYDDAPNNRFIVQWSRIHHIHGFREPYPAELQTFQVILLNPQYYNTQTGDGPIIFQYHTVFNDDSFSVDCHNYATVGIESPNLMDGLEYTFANQYPQTAAVIENGRAIKFTTNPPDTFTGIEYPAEFKYMHTEKFTAFPNPAKNNIYLNYTVSFPDKISLKIYDINGMIVKNLIDQEMQSPGNHQLSWQCNKLPAGVYFAILSVINKNKVVNQNIKIIIN
jgi:hypothetical protein